jgi:hypothetical protein
MNTSNTPKVGWIAKTKTTTHITIKVTGIVDEINFSGIVIETSDSDLYPINDSCDSWAIDAFTFHAPIETTKIPVPQDKYNELRFEMCKAVSIGSYANPILTSKNKEAKQAYYEIC